MPAARCGRRTWDGYTLERGAVEHTSILTSGVVEELDLAAHGLRYVTRTTAAAHLFGDGTRIVIEDTAEATAASIAEVSKDDARAWVELAELSAPLLQAFALASEGWIPPPAVATGFARAVAGRRSDRAGRADPDVRVDAGRPMVREPGRAGPGHLPGRLLQPRPVDPWVGLGVPATRSLVTAAGSADRSAARRPSSTPSWPASRAAGGSVRCGAAVDAVRRVGGRWHVRTTGGRHRVGATRRRVGDGTEAVPAPTCCRRGTLSGRQRRRIEAVREVVDNVSQLTLAAAITDAGRLPALRTPGARCRPDVAAAVARLGDGGLRRGAVRPVADGTVHARHLPERRRPVRGAAGWCHDVGQLVHRQDVVRPALGGTGAAASEAVWRSIAACLPATSAAASVHEVLTTPDDLTAHNGAENAGNHVAPLPDQLLGSRPARRFGNYRTPDRRHLPHRRRDPPGRQRQRRAGTGLRRRRVLDDARPRHVEGRNGAAASPARSCGRPGRAGPWRAAAGERSRGR